MRKLLLVTALLVAAPATALAQAPIPPAAPPAAPPTTPAPPPPPGPAPAKLVIHAPAGYRHAGATLVLAHQLIAIDGGVRPYVAGERVRIRVFARGRRVAQAMVKVGPGPAGSGRFVYRMRTPAPANYRIEADHKGTAAQAAASAHPVAFGALPDRAAPGSSGLVVRMLQSSLSSLGYVTSTGGRFDDATARAVLAYRSVNGFGRLSFADPRLLLRLLAGGGGFHLRYPSAGRHVEFDYSRQVVVLADGGRPQRIYHASSGKPSTPTVFGSFSFYSKQAGTNAKGMFDSNYFIGGYAIHGYPSVPSYPASHGCIRVPMADAASIFSWIRLGERIFVYR